MIADDEPRYLRRQKPLKSAAGNFPGGAGRFIAVCCPGFRWCGGVAAASYG